MHAKVPRNRTVFLVDGFNVYHSLRDAEADLGGVSTRWLNLRSLLSSESNNTPRTSFLITSRCRTASDYESRLGGEKSQ